MTRNFGLLTYKNSFNLGDEIQSLAAKQYLPKVDAFVDRDNMSVSTKSDFERLDLIANGWYSHSPEFWPAPHNITPLLISIHISTTPGLSLSNLSASEMLLSPALISYMKAHEPIGARDLHTLELLKSAGVDAYFSSCLTLTLERPSEDRDPDLIVLNDVPDCVINKVRERVGRNKSVLITSHDDFQTSGQNERFKKAQRLLGYYSLASSVLTTRLHCALPCLAFDTPVLVLDLKRDKSRFSGLDRFYRHMSVEDFISDDLKPNVASPLPNMINHLPYRDMLRDHVLRFINDNRGGSDIDDRYLLAQREYYTLIALFANLPKEDVGETASSICEIADLRHKLYTLQKSLQSARLTRI